MDSETLVDNQINDGRKPVENLLQRGFDLSAAFWVRATMNGKWYFYIVSPIVDTDGGFEAYLRLHPLVRAMPQPFWINPLRIKLIGMNHPIAKDVLAIDISAAGPRAYPIPWGGTQLGNLSVEGVYLYPLPAATP